MAEENFRDPARRRLLRIADSARADKGEVLTEDDLPPVDVPDQFETTPTDTGIRESILRGTEADFQGNLAQVREEAQAARRFRAGSTSDRELAVARAAQGQRIRDLGKFELESRGQVLSAMSPLAVEEQRGETAREIRTEELAFRTTELAETMRQFDISTTEGKRQFDAAMVENARQFDFTKEDDRAMFNEQLLETARQFDMDTTQKAQLAAEALTESARQFDLASETGIAQHASQMVEMARQFDLDQKQTLKLASDSLTEMSRQFDATQAQDMTIMTNQIDEMSRQFDLTDAQTRDLAANALSAQVKIAQEGLNVKHLGNLMNLMIEGTEALTAEDGNAIISAAFSMGAITRNLNIPDSANNAADDVISIVKGEDGESDPAFVQEVQDILTSTDFTWDMSAEEIAALSGVERQAYLALDFDGDGVVDFEDHIIYKSNGGMDVPAGWESDVYTEEDKFNLGL